MWPALSRGEQGQSRGGLCTAPDLEHGVDRGPVADVLAVVYSVGLFAAFTTSCWPLPSVRRWSAFQRIQSMCLLFLVVSYAPHLSWERAWLLLHDSIQNSRDAAWAYSWWAYIDGGDMRYATAPPTLPTMEVLSVTNGVLGSVGFYRWVRSRGTDRVAVLLFMATAVVHLYSTSLYFGGEILAGLPNVDTTSFLDTWIKFGLANAPWIVFPWFALYWGGRLLSGMGLRSA